MADDAPSKKNWQTYLSIGLSALGMVFFLIQALTMGIILLSSLVGGQVDPVQVIPIALLVWSALLSGVLLLPVFLLSLSQLKGREAPKWLETGRPAVRRAVFWAILIWPAVVALGWWVVGSPQAAIFLLGPINVLVAGLPVLWVFNAGSWRLRGGSHLRQWRIFGFSLTVMPTLVILVEVAAILILAGVGGLYIAFRMSVDPALERAVTGLFADVAAAGQDVDGILEILEPYFRQPSVLFWAAAVMGGVMPIIEEVVKPIALWPLARAEITAQEGYVGGLLAGAGFALMENILYFTIAVNPEDWLFMAIGRAGTGVLHMLASGLVGWGLVKTWQSGKWGAQALLSLGSFVLHGLWNALALFVGVAPGFILEGEPNFWETMLFNIPIILLLILSVVGMALINRRFRSHKENPAQSRVEKDTEEISAVVPDSVIGR